MEKSGGLDADTSAVIGDMGEKYFASPFIFPNGFIVWFRIYFLKKKYFCFLIFQKRKNTPSFNLVSKSTNIQGQDV